MSFFQDLRTLLAEIVAPWIYGDAFMEGYAACEDDIAAAAPETVRIGGDMPPMSGPGPGMAVPFCRACKDVSVCAAEGGCRRLRNLMYPTKEQ